MKNTKNEKGEIDIVLLRNSTHIIKTYMNKHLKQFNKNFLRCGLTIGLITSMNVTPVFADTTAQVSNTEDYIVVNELSEEEINMVEDAIAINDPDYQKDGIVLNGITYYTINDNGYQAYLSEDLQDWVYQMCAEYGIPGYEKLIISKLYCESGFNPNVKHRNKNGTVDYGIAQINSSNHGWLRKTLGITDFMDPYQSIRCGVYMMSENLKKNGFNESMALVAYNTGKNGISSTSYSRKVLRIKDAALAC